MENQIFYNNFTFDEKDEYLEDNLKDGMYVRTDNGIDRFNCKLKIENQNFYWYDFEKTKITNPGAYVKREPSYDIIDLIELGDYVNGRMVEEITSSGNYKAVSISYFYKNQRRKLYLESKDIISIVTKEQFESIKYVVKND